MTNAKQRLKSLVGELDTLSCEEQDDGQIIFWIDADGPVSLELKGDAEVCVSTPIYFLTNPQREICWGAIADFNASFLHDGGYRLFLEGEFALMVAQTKTLAQLEEIGLALYLEDFISRCGTCTCWYIEQVENYAARV